MTPIEIAISRLWTSYEGDADELARVLENYARLARGAAAEMRRAQLRDPFGRPLVEIEAEDA